MLQVAKVEVGVGKVVSIDFDSFDCSHSSDLDGLSSPDCKSLNMDRNSVRLDLGTLLRHWLVDMVLHVKLDTCQLRGQCLNRCHRI